MKLGVFINKFENKRTLIDTNFKGYCVEYILQLESY